jgi:tetratricopeptide (TPR) repeat protein
VRVRLSDRSATSVLSRSGVQLCVQADRRDILRFGLTPSRGAGLTKALGQPQISGIFSNPTLGATTMRAISRSLSLALVTTLCACAVNQTSPAQSLNAQGNQAYFAGKYDEALNKFQAAEQAATSSGDRQYQAIATYGMARSNVQLCEIDAADRLFKRSIELRNALPDVQYGRVTQNLVEYSRFLLSLDRPREAVPLMERAISDLDATGLSTSDPIAYSEFFDDYADALKAIGRDAQPAKHRAEDLRNLNPGRVAKFKPTSFPARCKTR